MAGKAVELALGGNPAALRICIDRILAPRRERAVEIVLPPVESAADIAGVMAGVTRAVAREIVTPGEAGELAQVAAIFLRAIETSDFDRRLQLLEKACAASG